MPISLGALLFGCERVSANNPQACYKWWPDWQTQQTFLPGQSLFGWVHSSKSSSKRNIEKADRERGLFQVFSTADITSWGCRFKSKITVPVLLSRNRPKGEMFCFNDSKWKSSTTTITIHEHQRITIRRAIGIAVVERADFLSERIFSKWKNRDAAWFKITAEESDGKSSEKSRPSMIFPYPSFSRSHNRHSSFANQPWFPFGSCLWRPNVLSFLQPPVTGIKPEMRRFW